MQLRGLRLDSKFADSALHTWAYARNILISRGFDEFEAEPGDTVFATNAVGTTLVGRITTPNDIILFTYTTTTTYIRHMSSTGTLTTIVTIDNSSTTLFDISATGIYIEGVHCYNYLGQLIIAWTTGSHKPMILNVTTALSSPIIITTAAGIKELYLFQEFDHNNFSLTANTSSTIGSVITGGRLPAAAYFFSLAYEDEPDVNTNFGVISSPIFITEDDVLTSYKQFKGSGSLVITNKSIVITATELDSTYNYFKLAIIQKTESGTNCYITKRIKVSGTSVNILIDDLANFAPYNLTEVIVSSPSFDKIKSITQANNRLRLFNCEKTDRVSIANIYDHVMPNLTINWVATDTVSLNETTGSYKDPIFIFNKRSFRDDEVYALYLGLKAKQGGYYGIYHIPGRAATGTELIDVTTVDGESIKNFRLGSSATKDGGGYYGPMGYWENDNEYYPTGFGTLGNGTTKVRHHRFPSAGQIHAWKTGILHSTSLNKLLETMTFTGDEFSEESNKYYGTLTPDITNYGTHIVASAVGNNYNTYTAITSQTVHMEIHIDCNVIGYGGSYKGRATVTIKKWSLSSGVYTDTTLYTETKEQATYSESPVETLEFTNSSTHINTALLPDEYITTEIYMESGTGGSAGTVSTGGTHLFKVYEGTANYDILGLRISLDWNSVNTTTKAALEAAVDGWEIFYAKRTLNNQLMLDQSIVLAHGIGYRFYGFDSMANMLNITPTHVKSELYVNTGDYNLSSGLGEVTNYSKHSSTKITKVTSIKYLPAFNSATVPSNEGRENCYYFEPYNASNVGDKYLVNLINVKNNVYTDFSNQELVSTGVVKPLTQTSAFSLYGGDTYVGHNSFICGVLDTSPTVWYFPQVSILNSGMRYEGENDYEKFYPATNLLKLDTSVSPSVQTYVQAMIDSGYVNQYLYNNDYHMLNTFRQDTINTELTPTTIKYPNTVFSSIPQPDSAVSMYWRKFKPLDYVTIPNDKGAIFKAVGNDKIVYIVTDYSIYRGIIVDQLITGEIDVALKTSEMFDRPVQELFDADGNYIKPWDREGVIFTPYGLVVADLDRGAIHVINEKDNEITKIGIEDWFRTTVKTTMTFGAKETIGTGVILGYDDIYKRLLVTLRNSNTSTISNLTLSFQFEKGYWVGFHNYAPDKYIWNANGIYQINSTTIRKMFSGNYGNYAGTYYNTIIDFIFNSNSSERVLLKNVKIVSSFEASGISYWDTPVGNIMIYSKNLCTGNIPLVKLSYDYVAGVLTPSSGGNILFRDGEWMFNDIKDAMISPNLAILDNNFDLIAASINQSKNWYDMSKFISKFFIVRLSHLNTSANRKLRISNVNVDLKQVL